MQSQIAKGAVISYISIGTSIIISFVYTPWMIKQIGVSDYGLYSLVLSIISYFILDFGLSVGVQRFIAKYRAENNTDKIRDILGLVLKAFLAIDAIIFLILFILYFFLGNIYKGLTADEITILRELYVIAGSFSILTFLFKPTNGAMMAFEYFVDAKLLEMFQKVGTVIAVIIALLLGGNVVELIFINGLFGFITSLLNYIVFKKKSGISPNFAYYNKDSLKELLGFSGWIFAGSLAQRLRLSILPSVLGVLASSTEISIMSLGMAMEGMVYMLSSALNGLFLPKVTSLLHSGENKTAHILMIRVGRLQEYVIAFILFGFWCLGQPFIKLWVGDAFNMTYYVVILLTITNFVSLTQHIAGDMIYAENYVMYTGKIAIVTALVGFCLSCILANSMGAIGCAIGFCVAETLSLVANNIIIQKKKLNINLMNFFKECQFSILPLLFVFCLFVTILQNLLPATTWMELIIYGIGYCIGFVLIVYYLLMNREEKDMFKYFRIISK